MKIFVLSASLRRASLNLQLAEAAARVARNAGAGVTVASLREFEMPLYDNDLEGAGGLPDGARMLQHAIEDADALMIASPEYNYSISGVLKNAIDWVSRARPIPWKGKPVYLLSASPSAVGGIRGLWQTRIPLEGGGALVFPEMFGLANAHQAFAADGSLKDAAMTERLQREVTGFVRFTEAVVPACSATRPRQKAIAAALEDESKIQPR